MANGSVGEFVAVVKNNLTIVTKHDKKVSG